MAYSILKKDGQPRNDSRRPSALSSPEVRNPILSERARQEIFRMHFEEGQSLKAIARTLGMTEQGVAFHVRALIVESSIAHRDYMAHRIMCWMDGVIEAVGQLNKQVAGTGLQNRDADTITAVTTAADQFNKRVTQLVGASNNIRPRGIDGRQGTQKALPGAAGDEGDGHQTGAPLVVSEAGAD